MLAHSEFVLKCLFRTNISHTEYKRFIVCSAVIVFGYSLLCGLLLGPFGGKAEDGIYLEQGRLNLLFLCPTFLTDAETSKPQRQTLSIQRSFLDRRQNPKPSRARHSHSDVGQTLGRFEQPKNVKGRIRRGGGGGEATAHAQPGHAQHSAAANHRAAHEQQGAKPRPPLRCSQSMSGARARPRPARKRRKEATAHAQPGGEEEKKKCNS